MPLDDESFARLLYFELVKRINLNRGHRDTFLDRRVNCALRANAERFLSAAAMPHTTYAAGTLQRAVERRYGNAVIRRTITHNATTPLSFSFSLSLSRNVFSQKAHRLHTK